MIPFDEDFDTAVVNGYNFSYPKLCAVQESKHDGQDKLQGVSMQTQGTLLLSAVKKAEKDDGVIVRLYNPLQETATLKAKTSFRPINLAETEEGGAVTECAVASKKIITVKIN